MAQSLGVETVDPDVMKRPPRSKSEPIVTRPLVYRILLSAFVIVLGTMAIYVHENDFTATDELDHDKKRRRGTTMVSTDTIDFSRSSLDVYLLCAV